ncbi:MAG: response regulator [Candidatus Omnitrophota bacterium]
MSSGKILIIDDDQDIVHRTQEVLVKAGYTVCCANSSVDAFKRLKSFLPDLILLDLVLPDESGFRVAQKIKSTERYKDIPIVAASFKKDAIDKHIAAKNGIVEYLEKPIDMGRLLFCIRDIVGAEREQSELEWD